MLTSKKVVPFGFVTQSLAAPLTNFAENTPTAIAMTQGGAIYVSLSLSDTPVAGLGNNSDGVAPVTGASPNVPSLAYNYLFDGTNFDRARSASLANFDPTPGNFPLGVTMTSASPEWALTHAPAVATKATISRAALANNKHVCRSVSATFCCAPADTATIATLNLRDGATGAGPILRSWTLAIFNTTQGGIAQVDIAGLNIVGTTNTAMTLEFAAAPGAASFQSVGISGITVK